MKKLLKNYTILYVEDEPSVQKSMLEYLKSYFKEVFVASNGKEGLEKYYTNKPDAMLLDVDLPYLDGLSLAKEVRSVDKKVSIVMLTAFTEEDKLLKATELKLLKYLVKPIDIVAFKETLDLLAEELADVSKDIVILDNGYSWNTSSESLYCNKEKIELSTKEILLLKLLIDNRHNSISFETIMAEVWVDEFDKEISFNSVKNLVSSLRKKLPQDCLKSVYGKGYMLC